MPDNLVTAPTTLSPLPPILHRGLTAVSFFGFLSFVCSAALFLRLAHRIITWNRKTRVNQVTILIANLVFADLIQGVAFLLNIQWVRDDAIRVGTATCWAQGWFVSTGDLASGIFTLSIAIFTFFDIVLDYRLGHKIFLCTIAAAWTFDFILPIIGIALHTDDFYVRADAWCWVNAKYDNERLFLHYLWVMICEFATVLIYTLIFLVLRRRLSASLYASEAQLRAESAAKLIVAYPIIYVVCTLPLVVVRLTSMTGGDVTFLELCVAGSMITSNGWLDVLLYAITRKALLFGPEVPDEGARALDTFRLRPDQAYGTTTHIEANQRQPSSHRAHNGLPHSRDGSTEGLVGLQGVKAETTVQVRTETLELEPIEYHSSDGDLRKSRMSFDSRSQKSGK